MDPNIRVYKERGRGGSPTLQIKKLRQHFDGKTQAVRGALIADLEAVHVQATQRFHAEQDPLMKQKWGHLIAYIAQTIAYIAGAFDTAVVDVRIKKLEEMVSELLARQKAQGTGGSASGTPRG